MFSSVGVTTADYMEIEPRVIFLTDYGLSVGMELCPKEKLTYKPDFMFFSVGVTAADYMEIEPRVVFLTDYGLSVGMELCPKEKLTSRN
ncbi:hypothetical protein BC938DRAFT_474776 [Jimgerdemannia flammicorona]|uniref:Uncharacterized protein n=1 Tax=Jimgerdemannia flammicorona TaxID=994334 RepID=A0A433Q1J3_9FUNG|nr:hypothetical protein BC938DRAFT_474776 [Jimgerdemannia flammicorona]